MNWDELRSNRFIFIGFTLTVDLTMHRFDYWLTWTNPFNRLISDPNIKLLQYTLLLPIISPVFILLLVHNIQKLLRKCRGLPGHNPVNNHANQREGDHFSISSICPGVSSLLPKKKKPSNLILTVDSISIQLPWPYQTTCRTSIGLFLLQG